MTSWPALPLEEWSETRETLNRWMQIIGKIRLAQTPLINHWWNVPLYVTARGLTTSEIPYGDRWFDFEFDFVGHVLRLRTGEGAQREMELRPRSVADLYREIFATMKEEGIEVRIWPVPVEIENPIRLDQDEEHRAYDPEPVHRFWQVLVRAHDVLTRFRAEFIGKCSPVHFFWGSFDLAVTRFSGRPAPPRPGADAITREGYSHEVSSAGFWPGDSRLPQAAFYSYAAPEPEGFRDAVVRPAAAYYSEALGGYYLHYDEVRRVPNPEQAILDFCRSTYEAAADRGGWDRAALERRG